MSFKDRNRTQGEPMPKALRYALAIFCAAIISLVGWAIYAGFALLML